MLDGGFYIEGCSYVPGVDFQEKSGMLDVSIKSYHQCTLDFLSRFLQTNIHKKIEVNFNIYDKSSPNYSKKIIEIEQLLSHYKLLDHQQVDIHWIFGTN